MYLSYSEYTAMGGTITEAAYTRFEFKARKSIDYYTFNRLVSLTERPEAVRMCMFELINTIEQSDGATGAMSSERIGDYSVSYASNSTDIVNTALSDCINEYLANEKLAGGTPLLYMGVST